MPNKVIQITPSDVSAFAKEIDGCINRSVIDGNGLDPKKFAIEVAIASRNLSTSRMQTVGIPSCNVSFKAADIEYIEWAMGLLLLARSAEILRRKARDGHCYVHPKPCQEAQPIDESVYKACLDSFETLLKELKGKKLADPD